MDFVDLKPIQLTTPEDTQLTYSWLVNADTKFPPARWQTTLVIPNSPNSDIFCATSQGKESVWARLRAPEENSLSANFLIDSENTFCSWLRLKSIVTPTSKKC